MLLATKFYLANASNFIRAQLNTIAGDKCLNALFKFLSSLLPLKLYLQAHKERRIHKVKKNLQLTKNKHIA